MIGHLFDFDKLSDLLFENTRERLPLYFKYMLKWVMMILIAISFVIGLFVEITSNPLKLPGWAKFLGLIMMFTPIVISLIGICVPKKKFLCCLAKYLAPDNKPNDINAEEEIKEENVIE